jgi:hypothetical protein
MGGQFLGAFGYADDVLLLAPSRQALQIMLTICEEFSTSHSMLFSTDPNPVKSRTVTPEQVVNVQLNAILFDKVHQIQQQFGYLNPRLVIKLLSIYSTALYGSCLWQLASDEHLKLNRSWNVAVKMIWDLPHSTHTRFVEPLSPVPHLEAVLMSRYIGFVENLMKTKKSLLRLILNSCCADLSSQTGQNLEFLLKKYKKLTAKELILSKKQVKSAPVYPISSQENWKVNLAEEISLIKAGLMDIDFDIEDLEEILEHICTE